MHPVARTSATPAFRRLVQSVRAAACTESDPARIAERVAAELETALADPDLLGEDDCRHDQERYCQNILHVEDDGSFSIVALVWLPGQLTPVHDHVSWCVTGVYRGREHETRYRISEDPDSGRPFLLDVGRTVNETGAVAALCPPGDIHRVGNRGPETAVSLHIYGANIAELGSSIRRCYELEIRSDAEVGPEPDQAEVVEHP